MIFQKFYIFIYKKWFFIINIEINYDAYNKYVFKI